MYRYCLYSLCFVITTPLVQLNAGVSKHIDTVNFDLSHIKVQIEAGFIKNPYGDNFQFVIDQWVNPAPFAIQRYATSCQQYLRWLNAKRPKAQNNSFNETEAEVECSYQELEPVSRISWHEAQQFCQSLDGRLPSETEWITAAALQASKAHSCYPNKPIGSWQPITERLSTDATAFQQCTSETWPSSADITLTNDENAELKQELLDDLVLGQSKMAVNTTYPSVNGVYGLQGNVWEWTSSNWSVNSDNNKVIKGGAFSNAQRPYLNHPLWRNYSNSHNSQAINIGFRCAWSL